MPRQDNYNTKQQAAVLNCLSTHADEPLTAGQISAHLKEAGLLVGRTTVYRQLDKLIALGKARKYAVAGIVGACFQYAGDESDRQTRLHLKCEDCGRLFDMDCDLFEEVRRHFAKRHVFQIDVTKTVMYGMCEQCISHSVSGGV